MRTNHLGSYFNSRCLAHRFIDRWIHGHQSQTAFSRSHFTYNRTRIINHPNPVLPEHGNECEIFSKKPTHRSANSSQESSAKRTFQTRKTGDRGELFDIFSVQRIAKSKHAHNKKRVFTQYDPSRTLKIVTCLLDGKAIKAICLVSNRSGVYRKREGTRCTKVKECRRYSVDGTKTTAGGILLAGGRLESISDFFLTGLDLGLRKNSTTAVAARTPPPM